MKFINEIKKLGADVIQQIIDKKIGRSSVASILGTTERQARNVIEEIRKSPELYTTPQDTQLKVKSGNKADDAAKARDEQILKLANAGGLSHREIADIVGCGRSTVGHVLKRLGFVAQSSDVPVDKTTDTKVVDDVKTAPAPKVDPNKYRWMMGTRFLTIVDNEEKRTYSISNGNPNFKKACDLTQSGDLEGALAVINTRKGLALYTRGFVKIDGNKVFYKNLLVDSGITQRIIDAMQNGDSFEFLVKFFEKLMLNPSNRAVNELYGFMQHNDLVIDEDGDVLAFKRVNNDYTDMYSGTIDNSPGKTVEVERNQVNEDSNVTCSYGLHVAAKSYIPHYNGGRGRVVLVKVSPADFVSIPKDYNNAKARVCKYIVLDDITDGFSHY